MTILARPSEWTRNRATASSAPVDGGSHRYFAFLSYSHRNQPMADWLHQALERFVVPSHLVGRITDHGPVPKRLTPIFRDLNELPASDDLGHEIRSAIAGSRFLIVLCSPSAARSRWTNAEIEVFKRVRPDGCIFAAIVDGEPFASDLPGREDEECLPKALRFKYDRRGRQTTTKAEPLAADLRGSGEVRRLGFLKLVAGMLGLGLDELVQRDTIRRQRRLATVAGGSLVGMLIATGLAVTAIQARDTAREQRREAEGLVGFMLGDLRAKLEPLGRLDTLDAVGARALAYYQSQDKGTLSDESLTQRSKALTLMGEIANTRGNLDRALQLYREAYASTAEAVRRDPNTPQRLWDHAQNVFWVGEIAHQRGLYGEAEASMREYKRLADAMVAIEPDNPKWRLEVKYANTSLGALLFGLRRYAEASPVLQRALESAESLAAGDPSNVEYQKTIIESLAWLADSQFGEGRIDEAIAKRERQVAAIGALAAKNPSDADIRAKAITAHRALGRWLVSRGSMREGLDHQRTAVRIADELLPTEPANMDWLWWASGAQLDYAASLLQANRLDDAAVQTRAGCDRVDRLAAQGGDVAQWRALGVECLIRRAKIAMSGGSGAEALALSTRALSAAKARRTGEPLERAVQVSETYKLIGDIRANAGNRPSAEAAWQAALAGWPKGVNDPRSLALRAEILTALGREAEARPLKFRLEAIGYRRLI